MIAGALWLLAELVILFFGVAAAIHLFQRRVGERRLRAWMGGHPVGAALKGIGVGFLTPFCTYSAIPMLIGLQRAGVPPAGYVAFIVAAPVLDPVLFGALAIIASPAAAGLYTVVALLGALALALVAQRTRLDEQLRNPVVTGTAALETAATGRSSHSPRTAPADSTEACTDQRPWRGFRRESRDAVGSAFALLRSVIALLVAGVLVGLAIESLVTPEGVAAVLGANQTWGVPLAAALGTPLYFHTSLFVPIANSLANAGVGTGPIVALTIAGAGANVPEFVILSRLVRSPIIGIFMAYVFGLALIGGGVAHLALG